ncbi:MAG: divalent metal cation transporter [Cryobacterium sp.]|nr:divalent metal cation transporter [Oligoflexia bacterium]
MTISFKERCLKHFKSLGPGLITGASGDDPSGIATYSQTGAQFGFQFTWTLLFTYPLMCAVQIMCARLGRITGRGIAGNLRRHYPKAILYPVVFILLGTNIINLGADIGAMAAAVQLMVGGPILAYCLGFAVLSSLAQVFIPYTVYVRFLRWLCLSLLAYVASAFIVKVQWLQVLKSTLIPHMKLDKDSIKILIAILGATISPYLFFWQAGQEVEEMECSDFRKPLKSSPLQAPKALERIQTDTLTGMWASNLIGIFIIIVTAVTLHASGKTQLDTAAQAAEALKPIAGKFAFFLFSMGMIGTGLLTVPILAGSGAYAVGEALGWTVGLETKPIRAKAFYGVIVVATLLGFVMNAVHLDPIKALIWTAIINGIVAVPIIALTIHMSTNEKVIGDLKLTPALKMLTVIATLVMLLAVIFMVIL